MVAQLYGSKNAQLMMTTFLAVTGELIDELAAAIHVEDEERLLRTAHELKGAALQVRASDIAKLCLQIEEAGRRKDGHEVSAAYLALWHAFLRVKALVDRTGPPATAAAS